MDLALSQDRKLRIASFTAFYVAQGLPIGLISIALPAWLAELQVEVSVIATFIAVSGLPWGFKLLAGPIMDRITFLPMGRRRPWVIVAQAGLLLSIMSLMVVDDPVNNMVLLTLLATVINFFAAVQDVAVDGMAIDILPVQERGRANAFMAFGQVAGYSGSGAICAYALINWGLSGASVFLSLCVLVIFVWGIIVKERAEEKLLPWTRGEAVKRSVDLQMHNWGEIFTGLARVMFMPASLLLLFMALFWRSGDGFWLTIAPVISVQELGYDSNDYSYWYAIAGFIAASLGLLLGPLIDRTGSQKILMISLAGSGCFYLLTGFMPELWSTGATFPLIALMVQSLFSQGIFISFIALHMNICWVKVSATQFAIYMAWSNLARSIGASLYGGISDEITYSQAFLIMGVFSLTSAGIVAAVKLKQHESHVLQLE